MAKHPTRRDFAMTAAGAAALAATAPWTGARAADTKTLRFIAQSDLRVLDPIWTTAYVTRNHGYMVFDTLFALDAEFAPHPQMVGDFKVSPDKLTYNFSLRDGLKFHDGQPVRGIDCTTSLKRWMARDALGQSLSKVVDQIGPDGDNAFSIKLKEAFPLLIDGLAKVSTLVPFIMPERLAKTDPFTQVTEMVGSGPFKFVKDEFQPGNKVVYAKFADYVPRKEPPSWASGGKVAKVDRVEWLYVPDKTTAAASLNAGEVDWWEDPPNDLLPVLTANPDVTVANYDPIGIMTMVRFNQLYPPFDNPKMREAVLSVTNQADFMEAVAGDKKNWQVCASFFACGTPMSSDAGSAALTGPRDFDKAKKMIADAGYKGEKIVVLDGTDLAVPHTQAVIVADLMKKLGLNVDLQAMDWGQEVTRRASKKKPEEGGWNVFGTGWIGADMLDPTVNQALRANGDNAWFGWAKDDKIEELRAAWVKATNPDDRKKIAVELQEEAFESVPYIPTGMFMQKTAYRNTLKGRILAPAILMWNVEKT